MMIPLFVLFIFMVVVFLLATGIMFSLPHLFVDLLNFLYLDFPGGKAGFALLVLRVSLGALFVQHGYPKITNLRRWAKDIKMPVPLSFLAAIAMYAGGYALLIGFFTPFVSLSIMGTMLFAMFTEMSNGSPFTARDPFQIPNDQYQGPNGQGDPPSWEKAFMYVIMLSVLAIIGPGLFSADAAIYYFFK